MVFVVAVSKQSVVVGCCFEIGSLDINAPFRKRITSRGVDLTRRRVEERVEVVDEVLSNSLSLLLVELKPNVVVFESIRVASSAMITTLAFGSKREKVLQNGNDDGIVFSYQQQSNLIVVLRLHYFLTSCRGKKKQMELRNNIQLQSYARDSTLR